jgi:Carboxypeptidase regulatory-like domain
MRSLRTLVFCLVALAAAALAQTHDATPAPEPDQIAGTVVDFVTSQPLAGAAVQIASVTNRSATVTVRTGPDGHFAFSGLARGKYSLGASYRGYPAQGYEQHDAYSTAIAVGPGLDSTHLVFRLRPGATIRGRVIDEENEPVNRAMIRLFVTGTINGRTGTRIARMATTDDQGSYTFAHLPDATYYVAVNGHPWYAEGNAYAAHRRNPNRGWIAQPGQQPATEVDEPEPDRANDARQFDKVFPLTFFNGTTNSAGATPIDLTPGANVTADITVRSLPAVHLRVPFERQPAAEQQGSFPNGSISFRNAPPRVEVFQRIFEDTLINVATGSNSDERGLDFSGFPAGRYLIQVSKPGETNASGAYQEAELAGEMDVPTGAVPTATLSSMVQFQEAPPRQPLVLMLHNIDTQRTFGTRFTGNGEFQFEDALLPGRYEMAIGNMPGWYLSAVTATGAKLSGRTLHITGGENIHLNLKIAYGLTEINGSVMRDDKPWSGAMVVLVPRDPGNTAVLFRRDQSDSDGTFTLRDVVPGQYTLLAIQDGWKLAWTNPTVLKPYLAKGAILQVSPSAKLQTTVTVQDR